MGKIARPRAITQRSIDAPSDHISDMEGEISAILNCNNGRDSGQKRIFSPCCKLVRQA